MRKVQLPSPQDFIAAREAVQKHLDPTPVIGFGQDYWLKLETQQPIGAFKVRGAIAALSQILEGESVITASAGNHALGIAWASSTLNVPATIVVSNTVSTKKLELLVEMGANVIQHGESFDEAEAFALQQAKLGSRFVSAYNDPHVIAGQATVLDEILDQIEGDLTVITPVGGGGLAAGIVMRAAMESDRQIRVIGVEAENSQAVSAAIAAGHTVTVDVLPTLADGLAGNMEPGSITADILRDHDMEIVSVTEAEIEDAMRALFLRHDIRAEGSAAVSYAALERLQLSGTVVALITGRNVSDDVLQRVLRNVEVEE